MNVETEVNEVKEVTEALLVKKESEALEEHKERLDQRGQLGLLDQKVSWSESA